jgi:hypothetical protein
MAQLQPVDPNSLVGSNAPDLPPIDLPQEEPRPRTRLRVTVSPDRDRGPLWEDHGAAVAKPPQDRGALWGEQEHEKPSREIGAFESGLIGAREGVTFGAYPAIHGVSAAGEPKEPRKPSEGLGDALSQGGEVVAGGLGAFARGLYRTIRGDEEARKVYDKEREAAKAEQESARLQNPKSYFGGQLASAFATPIPGLGAAKAATTLGRVARGGVAGGLGGALYGGGEALSEGGDAGDVAKGAGLGLLTGGAVGAGGSAALQGGSSLIKYLGRIGRGIANPTAEAERQFGQAIRRDYPVGGSPPVGAIDPEAHAAARRAGMPVPNIDYAGQHTIELARAAANLSPEAWAKLENASKERVKQRGRTISESISRLFGGSLDSKLDQEKLEIAGRAFNRPRYLAAYRAGAGDITSPRLAQLIRDSDALPKAMKAAESSGKNWAALEGIPFDPNRRNIQYWDYVQRELRDMAQKAEGREGGKAAVLNGLHGALNSELDAAVPAFQRARAGAATFFRARDMSEAGRNFIKRNGDAREAARGLASANPAERELFARGAADELAQAVMANGKMGTIDRLFTSPRAEEQIRTALGNNPARIRELEALLRAQTVAQRSKDVLAGSTTAKQMGHMAAATGHGILAGGGGAGMLAAYEYLKEGDVNPASLLKTALLIGIAKGVHRGSRAIDQRVATKVGDMLASNDPAILRKGAAIVARSPKLFDALRQGTEAGSRVTAHVLGPAGVAATAATALEAILSDEAHEHVPDHASQQIDSAIDNQ